MLRRLAGLFVLVLAGCKPAGRPAPSPGASTAATAIPEAVITRGRGAWRTIAAPPTTPVGGGPVRGIAVGRELLARHPGSGWLASYDPCAERWQAHEAIPQPLRGALPIALDASHAAFCCGPPDRSGVLIDMGSASARPIASMPRTPHPGRPGQVLGDGLLIPADKRFVTGSGAWRVIAFDDAVYQALGQQGSAVASSGSQVLSWGGDRWDDRTGANVVYPGGAVFDGHKDSWRLVARAGAPSPRSGATIVWTGAEFFVYGGQGVAADGSRVTLGDGGRYDPATDRWQPVRGGPLLEGPAAGTMAGGVVIVWDARRGAAHDLRTGSWRELGLPAAVPVQNRPFGSGRVAVITDTHAFVLDPGRLSWARTELPRALHGRSDRVHVMTASHLVVWAGERRTGAGGCENPPPGQGCDPVARSEPLFDGAALALGSCR